MPASYYTSAGKKIPLRLIRNKKTISANNASEFINQGKIILSLNQFSLTSLTLLHSSPNTLVSTIQGADFDKLKHFDRINPFRNIYKNNVGEELLLSDEIIIKFSINLSQLDRELLVGKYNCRISRPVDYLDGVFVLTNSELSPEAPLIAANLLAEEEYVTFAHPNFLQQSKQHALPLDPLFPNQWYLSNTAQFGGIGKIDIRILEAWNLNGYGSSSIKVAVHDSGIDIYHEDLIDNILPGKNFDAPSHDPSTIKYEHGTACAGIIAGSLNGKGIIGVAPNCKILPIKIWSAQSWKTWSDSLEYAARNAEILSCSWSIGENDLISSTLEKISSKYRDGKGVPCVFSVGNEGKKVLYPARLKSTIGVGACNDQGIKSLYSNEGDGIDIVAPSSGGKARIETTDLTGTYGANKSGNYLEAMKTTGFGGTSAAAPQVAGVIALMLSANPNLNVEQIRNILTSSAIKIDEENGNYDSLGRSNKYGYGLVCASEAVKMALSLDLSI